MRAAGLGSDRLGSADYGVAEFGWVGLVHRELARQGWNGLGSDEMSAQKFPITVHTSWKKSCAPRTIRSLPNVPLPDYTVGLNPHFFRQSKWIFPMPKKKAI